MRSLRAIALVFCLALGGLIAAPGARADEWNKKTIVTFNNPVEIPGKVLPAGTYVFKLADSAGDRNIVQIFNQDETQLIATVLAIPAYRDRVTDTAVVRFAERPADSPEAVQSWFYPGDQYGAEFVYPRTRALELAQANQTNVPLMANESAQSLTQPTQSGPGPSAEALENQPVNSATPEGKETDVAQDQQKTQEPAKATGEPATEEKLPKTASPFPLVALIGALSLLGAAGVRAFEKQLQ